jgi:hypothetical protein
MAALRVIPRAQVELDRLPHWLIVGRFAATVNVRGV